MNLLRYPIIWVGLILLLIQTASNGKEQANSAGASSSSVNQVPATFKSKVSLEEARKIAQANAKGDNILEKLDQIGDTTCFSFDIKDSGEVKQVLVDSMTGQVIIVEKGPSSPSPTPHLKMPSLRPH